MTSPIRLALDWTPTTNHTGFYVAQANGYYAEADVAVEFVLPDQDRFLLSPAKRLVQGDVELALTSSECVVGYQLHDVPLVAVAAVLALDASAIVTLKQSGIDRPAKLDGKVYASHDARFEDEIVRQLIRNDGGRGSLMIHATPPLTIWNALQTVEADAAWICLPWQGIDAEMKDIQLNKFVLDEFEIPYGYNPLLVVHRDWMEANTRLLSRFMQATIRGFMFAMEYPEEAAQLLIKTAAHPSLVNADMVEASQLMITDFYTVGNGHWGVMRADVWRHFVNWLIRQRLLTTLDGEIVQQLDVEQLYTNSFLGEEGS